ncbi:MAG: hypothetical protein Q7K57_52695 [Burkholderiaceae bacterium]|nr:hypothetical protein [Burkholderiaceae bacterium]
MAFPIGYHSLDPDASMNFQMNRWFGWAGEPEMLAELRVAAARIAGYADWKREFLLRAGSEDHYVPVGQWHQQIGLFKHARSTTARPITRSDGAQNHGLALRAIANWLDAMLAERARPLNLGEGVCE